MGGAAAGAAAAGAAASEAAVAQQSAVDPEKLHAVNAECPHVCCVCWLRLEGDQVADDAGDLVICSQDVPGEPGMTLGWCGAGLTVGPGLVVHHEQLTPLPGVD